jgi:hypothetical protein
MLEKSKDSHKELTRKKYHAMVWLPQHLSLVRGHKLPSVVHVLGYWSGVNNLSSSCVPYVASFSGLSIFHCPFAASVFSNVYFITRFTGQIVLSLLSHGRLRGDGCLLLTNSLIHVPLTGVCDPVLDSSVEVARPWAKGQ